VNSLIVITPSEAIKLLRKNFLYLLVIFNLIVFLAVLLSEGSGYWYDEIITTEISREPTETLINNIHSEPHPPGFYYLLKVFPVDNQALTRLCILLLSHSLLILSIVFATKSGVISKYNLQYGFAVLVASPFWIDLSSSVKQDSLSIPLLIFAMLLGLHQIKTKSHKSFMALALVVILSLSIGYINFIKACVVLVLSFFVKPTRLKAYIVSIVLFASLIFISVFGHEQLLANTGRFAWQKDQYQGIVTIIYYSIGGSLSTKGTLFLADIIFILSIAFLLAAKNKIVENKKFITAYLALLTVYIFVIGVASNRYIIEVLLIYVVFIGWGLRNIAGKLNGKKRRIVYFIFALFYINGVLSFISMNRGFIAYKNQNLLIDKLVGDKKTGIIDRHPVAAYVRKEGYFKHNSNALPVNPHRPIENYEGLLSSIMFLDGKYTELSQQEIIQNLEKTQIDRFIYIAAGTVRWVNLTTYYDPHQDVLSALNSYCKYKDLGIIQDNFLITFEGCNNSNHMKPNNSGY